MKEHPTAIRRWARAKKEQVKTAFMRSWKRVLVVGTAAGLAVSLAACSSSATKSASSEPVMPSAAQGQVVETPSESPTPEHAKTAAPTSTVMGYDTSKAKIPADVKKAFGSKVSASLTVDTLANYQTATGLSFYANARKTKSDGSEDTQALAKNLQPLKDSLTASTYKKLYDAAAADDPDGILAALIPATNPKGQVTLSKKKYAALKDGAFETAVNDVTYSLEKTDTGAQYVNAALKITRQINLENGKVWIASGTQNLQMIPNDEGGWSIGGWGISWDTAGWAN